MKNSLHALLATALLVGTLPLCVPNKAYAADYYTHNDHVLNGGVGNYGVNKRYYFIDPSASTHTSLINAAMNSWIDTTNRTGVTTPISYRSTTVKSDSILDIYEGALYYENANTAALTSYYLYNNYVSADATNWGWCDITLNTNPGQFLSESDWNKQGTIAHEMGHSMGLAHNFDYPSVIMNILGANPPRDVNMPTNKDLYGINHLYY